MDKVEQVKKLREEYERALDAAESRRSAYHEAVLDLYRGGTPLREIAKELGLSHQRVHQIVSGEPPRRSKLPRAAGGAAGVAVILAAVTFGTLRLAHAPPFARHATALPAGPSGSRLGAPTLARPLQEIRAQRVSLRDAARAFGTPMPLPNTSRVNPSDVGAVWVDGSPSARRRGHAAVAAVTFPTKGMFIIYTRPATTRPLAYIRGATLSERSNGAQFVWLGRVPAWAIPQRKDGSNSGMIQFIVGATMVQVDGHSDLASLEAVAQSIVGRAGKQA